MPTAGYRCRASSWPASLTSPENASRGAVEAFGGKAFASLNELFDAVDYVDVCTPGTAHAGPVIAALEAGIPTVCEKPLANSVADCEEIVDAAERTGTPLFVAMVVRFFPQFAKAKEVLDSGAIGAPGVIRTVRSGSYPDAGSGWRKGLAITSYYADFSQSGGVLLDLCIHDIDYQRWCFGEIERVFARGMMFAGKEPIDHALLTVRFTNGAVGHIEGSWAYPRGRFSQRIEIAGTDGIIEWDSRARPPVELALAGERRHARGLRQLTHRRPRRSLLRRAGPFRQMRQGQGAIPRHSLRRTDGGEDFKGRDREFGDGQACHNLRRRGHASRQRTSGTHGTLN